jgi:hydroxymethylglutaryl-CoA lyase
MEFARPGLKKLIEKVGEKPGQLIPADWKPKATLPKKLRPKK